MNRLIALPFLFIIGTAWADPRSATSQAVDALDPIAKPISQALDQAATELTAKSKLFGGNARQKLQQEKIDEENARFQKMRQMRVHSEECQFWRERDQVNPNSKTEAGIKENRS
ncbi:hypothetical protein N5J43_15665 [Pseudomonas nicosulfuronedens]|uniref:hypothetical protein n=1 Tax=Pseudomonas nicosulfuronedens TaxID=2571105 RepID=UPI00244A787F|nr:hypothetical protein [Pseudomonas nicosulfuronedens]MDH1011622.1 hypothetical protein [Pseudomonas nicosulfuronedens]MDH1980388.1 hypothetical protein [Pseudomonas nicosulfuronedens]MDH2029392.1 hypothetical protein [Pseudomonas nicosulfuronedens]